MRSQNKSKSNDESPSRMLLDNKNHGKVIDELRLHLNEDAKLSVLTGIFSVFGFSALKSELGKIDSVRMLLSDESSLALSVVAGGTGEIDLKNNLNLQRVSKECADWVRKRVDVRSLSGAPIAQNIFHIEKPSEPSIAISGTSAFTAEGS